MLFLFGSVTAFFIGYLLYKGIPSLGADLVFGHVKPMEAIFGNTRVFDGLYSAVVGSIYLIFAATIPAIPIGIGAGIYLAEYALPVTEKRFGFFFDILAGIPSIVIGLFGFSIAIFLHKHFSGRLGPCLAISAMSLAFLVLPYIIRSTQVALESIPNQIRRTAPALGATKLQNLMFVLIPYALSNIVSGIILAIGRCAEDTAVIMLTGVVATAGIPSSPLAQYEALPFYIYYISSQYADQAELDTGYGACIILLGICTALFLLAGLVKKSLSYRSQFKA